MKSHFLLKPYCRNSARFSLLIQLTELYPVNRDRLSAFIFTLRLSNSDTLALALYGLFTLKLGECRKYRQYKASLRSISIDILLAAYKSNLLPLKHIYNIEQVSGRSPSLLMLSIYNVSPSRTYSSIAFSSGQSAFFVIEFKSTLLTSNFRNIFIEEIHFFISGCYHLTVEVADGVND